MNLLIKLPKKIKTKEKPNQIFFSSQPQPRKKQAKA
jgi:hypothetical protein